MNYPFNKTRVLSLAACAVLCTTMFTGCFGKKDPAPSTESTGGLNLVESTDPSESTAPATTTEPTTVPTTKPVAKANVATVKEKAPVRSAPTTDSNVLSQLNAGDEVEVNRVETNNGTQWAYIPLKGWVDVEFLDMSNVTVGGSTTTPAGGTDNSTATTASAATTAPTTSNNTTNNAATNNATGNGTVLASTLNVRESADKDAKVVAVYKKGDKINVLETKNGWGRTSKGWVSMTYVSLTGTVTDNSTTNNTTTNNTTTNEKVIDRGLVTGSTLNVRAAAGTDSKSVATYTYLTRVELYEKENVNGTTWGRTKDGWISLDYVYIDGDTGEDAGTGTVTGSAINVRQGPGTKYKVVGGYKEGDELDILAQFKINGTTWGCIKSGWVCMDYVSMGAG